MLQAGWYCFFYNGPATAGIYTLSLHDALPISWTTAAASIDRHRIGRPGWAWPVWKSGSACLEERCPCSPPQARGRDRKSTRLNSSHSQISYAVFCLKKKTVLDAQAIHKPYHH